MKPALWLLAGALLTGCRSDLTRGKSCYRVGDFERAKIFFIRALDSDPLSFEARYGLALVLQELSLQKKAFENDRAEDWSEVVRAYEVCSRLGGEASIFSQNYAFALFHLSHKLHQDKKSGAARDYLRQARKADPGNKYVLNLAGVVAYELGEHNEAEEIFSYLLSLDPDFLSAYLNLGNVYWELHRAQEAREVWSKGLERSPGEPTLTRRMETARKPEKPDSLPPATPVQRGNTRSGRGAAVPAR